MSQENVEIVRRIYDAWRKNDPGALDVLASDFVLYPAAEADWVGLEPSYHGAEGLSRYMELIAEELDDYHPEIADFLDAGDRVVTLAIESGRGKHSGAEVDSRTAHVWTIRDGKPVRLDLYWDRERALADLGLAE